MDVKIIHAYLAEDLFGAIDRAMAAAPCVLKFNNILTAILPGDTEMQVWQAHLDEASANWRSFCGPRPSLTR